MCAAPDRPALGSWAAFRPVAALRPVAELVEAQAHSQSVLGQGTVSLAALRPVAEFVEAQAHSQSTRGQGTVEAQIQGAERRRRRAIPAESTQEQAEIESSRLRSVKIIGLF
ncbi:MAG: hypothetical protein ACYC36_13560 [Bellilinea sp.]